MTASPTDVDRATMIRIASRAVGRAVEDVEWESSPLAYAAINPISQGLIRFAGTARVGPDRLPWSCVRKMSRAPTDEQLSRLPPEHRATVMDALRWDREADAYASGLLDQLPEGLVAPRCYAIDRGDRSVAIWLESIDDDRSAWDISRYRLAARLLGRWNGAYVDRRVPDHRWLARDWIRKWCSVYTRSAATILADDRVWSAPLVAGQFTPAMRQELLTLSETRERWMTAIDRLPQTLSHLDAFRGNMLGRDVAGRTQIVLLDWSFLGIAPLGAEPAQLVVGSVFYHDEPLDADAVEEAVLEGYAEGVRESGYRISHDELARSYVTNAVARWPLVLGPLGAVLDADREAALVRAIGKPLSRIVQLLADRTRYLCAISHRVDLG